MSTEAITRLNSTLEGRYAIERVLGEGGMATVYLAQDLKHNRSVALKVLKPELAAVVGAERFLAEIETTASLQHPNILPLFDSGEAGGFLFYVMPHVTGESLRARLDREHQLPVDEAVRIAADVAEALDYAHRQGVIHRDIKPPNILLADGKPMISDFGIALAVSVGGAGRLTETGLSLGTPHYMSPEQATGDLAVGAATDVYALGCVSYEMLVGEPPYTGSTPQAILGRIITGEPRRVSAERKAVPPHIEAAVARALEKVPADRFATAGAMAEALRDPAFRWGAGAGTAASGEVSRWRRRTWAVGALAATFALAFGWQLVGSRAGPGEPSLRYSSILLPDGYLLASGSSQPLSIAANGSRIALRLVGSAGGGEIWTRRFSEPEATLVPGGDDTSGSVFLSADGAWVAFNDPAGQAIRRASVDGGPSQVVGPNGLEQAGGGGFRGGSWGPNGEIVIATENGLRLFPADGSPPVDLTRTDEPGSLLHSQPSFLPRAEGVVYTETEVGGGSVASTEVGGASGVPAIRVLRFGETPVELTAGHSPHVTRDGILVYSDGAGESLSLSAVRLSSGFASVTGNPVAVAEGVAPVGALGGARYGVSDDGTLVYLSENITTTPRLAWVDRRGRIDQLVDIRDPQFAERPIAGSVVAARIAPDGNRIAFRTRHERWPVFRISVLDAARGVLSPLSAEMNADWPVWTPEGERLLFNRFEEGGQGEHNVYWARADNADDPAPFWEGNPLMQHAQDFSPDGRYLVYQQREAGTGPQDIWVYDLESGEKRPLLATPFVERQADVSPDGRWLAFVSDEGGRVEVYVTEFPEPRTRTKISTERAVSPVWSPTGEELYYMTVDQRAIMAVRVEPGATFRAGAPELVVEGNFIWGGPHGRAFDIHPDGERFLVTEATGDPGGVPRIRVVQNWLDEVRRRLDG